MRSLELRSVDGLVLDAAIHEPQQVQTHLGTVILAHGITVDMDEGGMFVWLAERLAAEGWCVLRFSYRGHGKSGGTQRGVTVAGEMLDLQAAVEHAATLPGPLSVLASSFGAVSATVSLPYLAGRFRSLVLWNPVLDLRHTFLEPELPWGLENFNASQQQLLTSQGYLLVDGEYELGQVLFEEFRRYRPVDDFVSSTVLALIVHGDQDGSVLRHRPHRRARPFRLRAPHRHRLGPRVRLAGTRGRGHRRERRLADALAQR